MMTRSTEPKLGKALTPREIEISRHFVDGESNKKIARKLGISFRTVQAHVQSIMDKLGASSRIPAAIMLDRQQRGGQ